MKRTLPIHLVTALLVVRNAWEGMRPDLWEWSHWLIGRRDFFFIWGYKARLVEHSFGLSFLAALPNDFSHPDYPLLVPLLFTILHPAILNALLGGGLLVVVHRALRRDFDPLFAALGTLALAGAALTPWPGFADGPLIAFAAGAALLFRDDTALVAAALLSLATLTKNEGIAFVAAFAVAMAIHQRKHLPYLLPPAICIAIWMSLRLAYGLKTDLFAGDPLARIAHNAPQFLHAFAVVPTHQPILWVVALLALAFGPRRERFLLTIAAIQLVFYAAAYLVTPLDLAGHVNGSWERISSHVTMLIAFAGVVSIGDRLKE